MPTRERKKGGTGEAPNLTLDEIELALVDLVKRAEGANKRSLSTQHEIGLRLVEVRQRRLVSHGAFGPWCAANFGIGKSQRADYMRLAKDWKGIPAARAWAAEQGLGKHFNTMSDVLKLLGRHKRSQQGPQPSGTTRSRRKEPLGELSTTEIRLVPKVYAVWADSSLANKGAADAAEFRLFRWAARRGVSIQAYLAAHGLKVPVHRTFDDPSPVAKVAYAA